MKGCVITEPGFRSQSDIYALCSQCGVPLNPSASLQAAVIPNNARSLFLSATEADFSGRKHRPSE